MTGFQAVCIFILSMCFICWLYTINKKLDDLKNQNVAMLYTLMRVLGVKHESAANITFQTFAKGGKDDRTKVSEEHSNES